MATGNFCLRGCRPKGQWILQLVEENQAQIHLLIKGNSASKSHLSPEEELVLTEQKVVPPQRQ